MYTFKANCEFRIAEDDDGTNVLIITDEDGDQVVLSRFESELLVDFLLEAFDDDCDCIAIDLDAAQQEDDVSCGFQIEESLEECLSGPCGSCVGCATERLRIELEIQNCSLDNCPLCPGLEAELRKY